MNTLNFKVTPTKVFDYTPTELELQIKGKEIIQEGGEDVEIVNVSTWLTQILPNGRIVEIKDHKLPVSVLAAFTGYDGFNPIINPQAVNQILAAFNLELNED